MTFVHPNLLYALALASIPLIIYYLMRFRSLKMPWGATYVLERALARLRKKLYLDQLLLLALRTLAIAALVFGFARPLARPEQAAVAEAGLHRIILVDGSYSMLAEADGTTAWQRGLAIANQLVGTWGRGNRWSLCLATDRLHWLVDDQPLDNPAAAVRELARLEVAETHLPLAVALEELLRRGGSRPTELYIVADDQAAAWEGVDRLAWPEAADWRVFWVNVAGRRRDNLAVTAVRLSQERLLAGHPVRAFVRVANYADRPQEDVEVEILADGRHVARRRLSLLPRQESQVHADVVFAAAGSYHVQARLAADALPFDNQMAAGLEVGDRLELLVLADAERGDRFATHIFLDLLAKVLKRGEGALAVSASPAAAAVEPGILRQADVVVVDAGTELATPGLVEALKTYVAGGGCLLLAPDDAVQPGEWNRLLGEADLLPARLGARQIEPLGGETYRQLSAGGFAVPALQAFETAVYGDIAATRFYSWFALERLAADAELLATFADGQPFAVRRRGEGVGSVLLLAAGLNCRNNNLLVRETGVALLVRLLLSGFSTGIQPRTVDRQQPIRVELEGETPPVGVQFLFGDDPPVAMAVAGTAAGLVATLPEGAARSGLASVLVVDSAASRRLWLGVQGSRHDSDLTGVKPETMARIRPLLNLREATSWEELDALLAASRRGAERYPWVIALALLFLIGELFMQRRFL